MSQPEPLTEQQLDEIAGRAAGLYEYATVADPEVQAALDELAGIDAPALLAEVRRQRAELAAVHAFLDEQELAARLFELPTPAWVEAVRAASGVPVAPLGASQPSEAPVEPDTATEAPTGRTGDPRRTLTPNEYSAAWHAVEGAAGEEGADPGTVLHAVLNRLGIDTPAAEEAGR